jgi:acyl-CoA synthetase (NDP forming)
VKSILQKVKNEGRDLLLPEAFEVLQAYGIPAAPYRVIHRKDGLKRALEEVGRPAVLKIISPEISHKSDIGGVFLNIDDLRQAEEAFEKIDKLGQKKSSEVLAQKMISGGKEVILGGKRDPSFGPVILFGLGGIYVEVLQEVSLRVAPINRSEAMEMITGLKAAGLLKGVRGERPSDVEALVENLLRLSQLMIEFPEIEGIDINPVMAMEKGTVGVDARIILNTGIEHSAERIG